MDAEYGRKELNRWLEAWSSKQNYQKELLERYKRYFSKFQTIFLFGGGNDARILVDYLEDIFCEKAVYFIDKNPAKHGKIIYKDIVCYGTEKIDEYDSSTSIIIISTSWYANEIFGELCARPWENYRGNRNVDRNFIKLLIDWQGGWNSTAKALLSRENILGMMDWFVDEESIDIFLNRLLFSLTEISIFPNRSDCLQYFPTAITSRFSDEEVFLDCGAFIGDTTEAFRHQTKDRFKAIYCFELSDLNFQKLMESSAIKDGRIRLIHVGVGDRNQEIEYAEMNESYSSYSFTNESCKESLKNDGYLRIGKVVSVDSLVEEGTIEKRATFVKMDIEGAEMAALRGMKKTLQGDRPKLAICVYHKPEDILEIPIYIHTLVPDYKFILRHHSNSDTETVLYAYID